MMCYNDIGLCAQNIGTNLHSIMDMIERTYVSEQFKRSKSVFTLDFYDFYISTLIG